MKKIFLIIFFVVILAPLITSAKIIEETKMAKALAGVNKDTIVVFDIDSTILEAAQTLGTDPWYYITTEKLVAGGMNKDEARASVLKQWVTIQRVTDVEPIEPNTPELIRKLQDLGIKVIALTARTSDLKDVTIKQLNSIGVDLTRNPLSNKDFDIELKGEKAEYFKGIAFCGGPLEPFYKGGLKADKGVILNGLLKKLNYTPKKVIFLDDRAHNVEAVDKALTSANIECDCIRYGGADRIYKTFEPKLAEIEMKYFGKVLSDDSARAILKFSTHKN